MKCWSWTDDDDDSVQTVEMKNNEEQGPKFFRQ